MKPTQEQVLDWAREAGFEDYHWTSLSGNSELDRTLQVGEYPVGESVFAIATIAYEAGRKDENEACAKICEDLPADELITRTEATVWDIATLDCAAAIRTRREQ